MERLGVRIPDPLNNVVSIKKFVDHSMAKELKQSQYENINEYHQLMKKTYLSHLNI